MFELWEESQYRALDEEGIENRRAAILEQLDGESNFTMEELRGQVDLLEAEIERRNVAVQLRLGIGGNRLTEQGDLPLRCVIKARNQADERRFAAARAADDAERFPMPERK